jgi:hypothetical protein
MKFRSPNTDPLPVALPSGHTTVIPAATPDAPDGIEVPEQFHEAAIRVGAVACAESVQEADLFSAPVPEPVSEQPVEPTADAIAEAGETEFPAA